MSQNLALAVLSDGLAQLFAAPLPAEQVSAWRSPQAVALLAELGAQAGLAAPVADLVSALGRADPESQAAAIALAHARLFCGVDGPYTVAPYESVHTSEAGLLCQAPAAEMQALLARLDLDASGLPAEPPDHIAVELALLAELLRRSDGATAARLLEDHLLRWAPDFAALCRARAPHELYAAAASLLTALLIQARAHLAGPTTTPSSEEKVA